jgi:hypothetical protein
MKTAPKGLHLPLLLVLALAGAPALAGDPAVVTLDLAGADFTVRPGRAGGQVEVSGYQDRADFKVKRRSHTREDGVTVENVRVRPRHGFSRFMKAVFTSATFEESRPELAVSIPSGSPMDLTLNVRRGESDVDLGGLSLSGLRVEMTSGEFRLAFSQPIEGSLESLRLRASRGEFDLEGLGNARARDLTFKGSAGEFHLDFDGDWSGTPEATAKIRASMGELNVKIPKDVRVAGESRTRAFMGDSGKDSLRAMRGRRLSTGPELRLDVRISMGETNIHRR